MADERLKQIWAGFSETTERRLTGKGVDNINVPHRMDYAEEDWRFLPEDFESPSERAFEALGEERAQARKKFGRKAKSGQSAEPDAPPPMAQRAFNGDELIKGLRATAMRTERSYLDYERFLSSDAGKAVRKKTRKKRFGIF